MTSKKNQNEKNRSIEKIVEPMEGILVFDHKLRPLFCNKAIKPLCRHICKSGTCVLEKGENETPELFKIIKRFRRDCELLFRSRIPRSNRELVPESIIYLSPQGNFTIRCLRLNARLTRERKALWQMNLLRAIVLTGPNIEIIDRKYGLTAAELEVLKHSIGGLSSAESARLLMVSNATIKMHMRHIFDKLSIVRRSQILPN